MDNTNNSVVKTIVDPDIIGVEGPSGSEIDVAALLAILARRKRLIALSALIGALFAGAAAYVVPNIYTAVAIIMPPQKEQSAATALLGQLGPIAAMGGAELGGLKTPSDLYVGLLGSRTIADHLIERYDLRHLYGEKTASDTRSKLKSRSRISAGRDTLIKIEVEDRDPLRAAQIANAYIAELNALNKAIFVTDAGRRRGFLEKRLGEEKAALTEAEEAMKRQQSSSGLIQPDAQTSVAIASIAQLRAQIAAGEVALERLKMAATAQHPEVIRVQTELAALRQQLSRLENGSKSGDALPATSLLPASGMEYLRRLRDLKYHELLFELLSKQYEAASLDEIKAAPDVEVVDLAVAPDKKSGPPRGLITVLGCIAGMLVAATSVYARRDRLV